MRPPTFAHERGLIALGYLPIGVDEAGCGCLAGPVVAAAVHLPMESHLGAIRDSKLLSAAQRERLLALFRERGYRWAVGVATHEEIDAVNIRRATYLAMRRAVSAFNVSAPCATFVLVDAWTIPSITIPQRGIIHGDRLVKSIAAASIIAKVTRDAFMGELDRAYPEYGFAVHKGYATAQHRAAIAQHGLSPMHRRTFCAT